MKTSYSDVCPKTKNATGSEKLTEFQDTNNSANKESEVTNLDIHEAIIRAKLKIIINLQEDNQPVVNKNPKSQQARSTNIPITGKKISETTLKAAVIYIYLHLYNLHPTTKTEDAITYLKPDFPEVQVEKLNSLHPDIYSSFEIGVNQKNREEVMNSNRWPSGVRINRFFLQRKKPLHFS